MPLQKSKLKHWSTLPNAFKGLIVGGYIGSITLIIFLLIIIYSPSLNNNYILFPLIFFFFCSSFGAFIGSRLKHKR